MGCPKQKCIMHLNGTLKYVPAVISVHFNFHLNCSIFCPKICCSLAYSSLSESCIVVPKSERDKNVRRIQKQRINELYGACDLTVFLSPDVREFCSAERVFPVLGKNW